MINEQQNIKISKFISLVLRHKPETIGLVLDDNGWANTSELIEKLNNNGFEITSDLLNHIVLTNNKKRFSFNDTKTKIRANQGHSIAIELNLKEAEPPLHLFHGTGEKNVASILATGLDKRERQHVHLSSDKETALIVGKRHGNPSVFIIVARQMRAEGYSFYLSDNDVWLIENVPSKYLELL
jgi:putative RNA 2'-phosphotransferase